MLKKKERLDRKAFNRFFSLGKRMHSPHLMLIYAPYDGFHAGAAASKKVIKTAVDRNKFRRRVYDVFERITRSTALQGVYICVAKDTAGSLSYDTLRAELEGLIRKTGVLG